MDPLWSVDTNILLRLFQPYNSTYPVIRRAVDSLLASGASLFYTSQMLSEFWNVCTRPGTANGLGMSIAETNVCATLVEQQFLLAPDSIDSHLQWRKLVVDFAVAGVQVHDARIVATLRVNHIHQILTLNAKDFLRYSNLHVRTPSDIGPVL